ncbi:MAG: arsinothricin resistance N-acetyltransferase ArsN1 [Actinomycetota bacterium]|nr:arsinothricin resistance N-acetyltransferase ArsN1 [Actinomycetota bacterium]
MEAQVRRAVASDAPAVVAIHAEAIADRRSTFETEAPTVNAVDDTIEAPDHLVLVAELDGEVVGWAAAAPYSTRPVYAGVAECSVYVTGAARGQGIGWRLAEDLAEEAQQRGLHKLVGKLFPTNQASRRLVERCGFRTVGLHVRHGQLDGSWRDVLLVERFLG